MHLDELVSFVRDRGTGVVSTIGPSGAPQAAYLSIAATDRGELVFDAKPDSRKVANLRRDGRVAVVVGGADGTTLQAEGVADLPSGEALERCTRAYLEAFPEFGGSIESGAAVVVRVALDWARHGDFRVDPPIVREVEPGALRAAPSAPTVQLAPTPPAARVRQLRLVASVPEGEDFDAALAFYRDVLGMPVQEAYEAEGDARVVILDAGRATLELSNAAQVRFIDRVEAEGRRSAPIRVALEVDDSDASTAAAVEGGAALVAEVRETPWRSRNSRLEGPAGLQLTLFQELGPEG